jgi:hypothetical protein
LKNIRGIPFSAISNLTAVYFVLFEILERTLKISHVAAQINEVIEIEKNLKIFSPKNCRVH